MNALFLILTYICICITCYRVYICMQVIIILLKSCGDVIISVSCIPPRLVEAPGQPNVVVGHIG